MIHYFPLERLETRYTKHLDDSIVRHLESTGVLRYYPEMRGREQTPPAPGKFLNAPITSEFKALQIAMFMHAYQRGNVERGDIVFFADLWHPGIIDLAYLMHFEGVRLDVRGLLWAGSFTDADLMRGAERWASQVENAIFDIVDRVFVTSEFMYRDLVSKRLVDPVKVDISYCPLDANLPAPQLEREPIVVFNGRDSAEKQPRLFDRLRDDIQPGAWNPDVEFVNAIHQGFTKEQYYDLLSRAKVAVSFALEETFGFGMLEAAALGCIPIVPDRLCYPEFFPAVYRYDGTYEAALDLVKDALAGRISPMPMDGLLADFNRAPSKWFAR